LYVAAASAVLIITLNIALMITYAHEPVVLHSSEMSYGAVIIPNKRTSLWQAEIPAKCCIINSCKRCILSSYEIPQIL